VSRGYVMIDQLTTVDIGPVLGQLEARRAHQGEAPNDPARVLPLLPSSEGDHGLAERRARQDERECGRSHQTDSRLHGCKVCLTQRLSLSIRRTSAGFDFSLND
jgi:hypothetical protein